MFSPGSCDVVCNCSHLTNFAALVVSSMLNVPHVSRLIHKAIYECRTFAPEQMIIVD